ncbi:uncharacterized protein LOC120328419 isoform X2 [Styela clava]
MLHHTCRFFLLPVLAQIDYRPQVSPKRFIQTHSYAEPSLENSALWYREGMTCYWVDTCLIEHNCEYGAVVFERGGRNKSFNSVCFCIFHRKDEVVDKLYRRLNICEFVPRTVVCVECKHGFWSHLYLRPMLSIAVFFSSVVKSGQSSSLVTKFYGFCSAHRISSWRKVLLTVIHKTLIMNLVQAQEAVEELLECTICINPYEASGPRTPKMLPCQHVFCLDCIKKIADGGNHMLAIRQEEECQHRGQLK